MTIGIVLVASIMARIHKNPPATRPTFLSVRKLRSPASRWYALCVDKGQRKRTADVAEKLGVGLLLGTMAQGIFAKEISPAMRVVGAIILAIAFVLIVLAIYLSRED